ncbi:unknown protein [Leptolyngbya sp. NIES-3755]|nr:unknown protein [Leptolyngbya sp. NIES-3755]
MTEQQQILEYIEALPSDAVKEIVREWVQKPDATLSGFKHIAEVAFRTKDIDTTIGFPDLSEAEILQECESRLQDYYQNQRSVPHEEVAQWLHSLSTDHPLPCPKSVG